MRRYKNKESFVELANSLHNCKYDYSQFEYKGKNCKGQMHIFKDMVALIVKEAIWKKK